MTQREKARWSAAAALMLLAGTASPLWAQGAALSLLPQDQGARPSPWSVFGAPVAPAPAPQAEPDATPAEAEEEDARPPAVQPSVKVRIEPKPRLVKVPLPPVPDRALRAAAAKAAPAPEEPPKPKATGIFALLQAPEGGATEPPAMAGEADVMRPTAVAPARLEGPATKVTSLDLSNPYRPRPIPGAGTRDDDLEDEESTKLVEKQVPSVEIACLKPALMALIHKAGEHFGATPVITSGFRSRGRRGSYHRKCEAADFTIPGVTGSQIVAYLRKLPGAGGVGTYCHTKSVHIDIGEPRDWHQCLFSRRFSLRAPVVAENGSN